MSSTLLTYRDYAALPDDGRRYEIHDGELWVMPAPSPLHQRLLGALYRRLHAHVTAHGLGEVILSPLDVILVDTTIVQPDLVYLDPTRSGSVSTRGIEGPPTLAIEVVSPSTVRIDRERKRQLYARYGVRYYWIVDPDGRAVEALALGPGGYAQAGRLAGEGRRALPPLGDLVLDAGALWREASGEG